MFGFGFLFRKAQATVDNAIAQLVWGLLIAVPLIVALGYATAAVSTYLHRLYEPEIADLIVAGTYAVIAAVLGIVYVVRYRTPSPEAAAEAAAEKEEAEANANASATQSASDSLFPSLTSLSPAEREMLLTGLVTAAPLAIRPLIGALFRNLPIVLAVAVAGFILTRTTAAAGDVAAPAPAAE